MTFEEYSVFILEISKKYKIDEETKPFIYALGLGEECGEAQGLLKKYFRDGKIDRELFLKELGDVLAYLTLCASIFDASLEDVANLNKEKLIDREKRNTLHGSGDER